MSDYPDYAYAIPGVDPSTLRLLSLELAEATHLEDQQAVLQAEKQAKIDAINAEYRPAEDVLAQNLSDTRSRITMMFIQDVLSTADDPADVRTIQLPSGSVEWRKATSDKLVIEDEKAFLRWAREAGVMKQVSQWRRFILNEMIEQLFKRRPELQDTAKGLRITRSWTLATRNLRNKRTAIHKVENLTETLL